ncbi:MAG: TIGR00341 family protein [Gammaproteobacteria bacterium]|nr:TIGR00341 family protein [Gammaproteobacteria bacterium]MDH5594122.1 TIGR00341 family protein [Gammaproteobacteria bacterium]MDH5614120.1 TIGR00341 family protein [Gammaproteobacteria bacterium]
MKIIEVITDAGDSDTLVGIAEQHEINDRWVNLDSNTQRCVVRMLVSDDKRQKVLDALQKIIATNENAHVLVIPVDAVLAREPKHEEEKKKTIPASVTREELYKEIEQNARLDSTYLLLVTLSTIVVSIGLLQDNVAVVIAAMVIAPLLGPNLALAFSTSLGDAELLWRSLKTLLSGLGLALGLSVIIGMLWPHAFDSHEVISRTEVGMESVVLALASGAAAVISITTGLSGVLVGVMVAIALLPPTAVLGLTLGAEHYSQAAGAGLLLAVNIVCLNLAAKLVFLSRGVKPRTWLEQRKARQSTATYIIFWLVSLLILVFAIYLREHLR